MLPPDGGQMRLGELIMLFAGATAAPLARPLAASAQPSDRVRRIGSPIIIWTSQSIQ